MPCPTAPVSPGGQLSHTSAAPFFMAAAYGMSLDCLLQRPGEGGGSLEGQGGALTSLFSLQVPRGDSMGAV